MAVTKQDFEFYRGDHVNVTITVRDQETKLPIDLAGATVIWRAIHQTTCEQVFEKSISTFDTPDQGEVKIALSSQETDIKAGRYDHVAVVTDGAGSTCTVTVGVITVKQV